MAAIVDEKIFCCHGGLSPDLQSMEQIRRVPRPTDVPDQGLLCDLLWSDPDKVRPPVACPPRRVAQRDKVLSVSPGRLARRLAMHGSRAGGGGGGNSRRRSRPRGTGAGGSGSSLPHRTDGLMVISGRRGVCGTLRSAYHRPRLQHEHADDIISGVLHL